MMMLIGPRHSSGAHDFRAPLEWRAPMKVSFRGPGSVDSWTLGPKPLCHRRPTGPHPSGLLWTPWTPAKGDSTKSNFALGGELPRHLRRHFDRHVEQHLGEGLGQGIGLERGH